MTQTEILQQLKLLPLLERLALVEAVLRLTRDDLEQMEPSWPQTEKDAEDFHA